MYIYIYIYFTPGPPKIHVLKIPCIKNPRRWRHTIRNCIFWHQSLEISYFWLRIQDSRHFQLAIYTVFHEESESAVRIDQILHPEEKIKKNQPYESLDFLS